MLRCEVPSEADFLDWLLTRAAPFPGIKINVGDDLAALDFPDNLLLVGVDQVLDGVHLNVARHGYRAAGVKAVSRNLSDCAAMACLPVAVVASAALPRSATLDDLKALHAGLTAGGAAFDCPLVGGDTGTWAGPLAVSVTVLGRPAGIKPLTRGGARPGDDLFVTGRLGGSMYEPPGRPPRHLVFTPRIELGRNLAAAGATAMMDLSDGLSTDLPRLCAAGGVGAAVVGNAVPIHEDAFRLSEQDGRSPLDHALGDGEDYELLAAAPATKRSEIEACGDVTWIGRITAAQDVLIDGERLAAKGWVHELRK